MRKVAVPVDVDNRLEDHFGHCDHYEIYTVANDNKMVSKETLEPEDGCGCKSNIASILVENGVTVMLAGGIGAGAISMLNKCGIDVVRGCSGTANEIVEQFASGNIIDSGETCMQNGHEHGEGHECSNH